MRLIGLAVIFTFSLTLAPLVAETQQAGKVWRIRYLSAAAPLAADETFRRALRELGYTEGQNITIASRIRSRHSVGRRWSNLQTSIVFPLCIQARGWSLSGACSPTGLASAIRTAGRRSTSTRSSKAPSPPTSPDGPGDRVTRSS